MFDNTERFYRFYERQGVKIILDNRETIRWL